MMGKIRQLAIKEITHGLNGHFAYLLIALFALTFAVPAFWARGASNVFLTGLADPRPLLGTLPLFLMVLVPALAMRTWAVEYMSGTHELLATWPLSGTQRICGKFLGLFTLMALAIVATFPIPLLISNLGDVDWGPVTGAYCGALLLGAACLAICLYLGQFTKDPVSAFLVGLGALGAGMFMPLPSLNLHGHFQQIARGVLDLKHLLFYGVIICGFLVLAVVKTSAMYRSRWQTLVGLVLIVSCALGTSQVQWRTDLTADKLYSLNQATLDVLAQLPGKIRFKVFFSTDLPPRFQPLAAFVKAQLDEYVAHSNGLVEVSYVDPDMDEAALAESKELGIFETRANVITENSVQAVRLWFGLALEHAGRQEVFGSVQSIENLEYELSGAIVRLIREKKPRLLMVGPTYAEGRGVVFDVRADLKPVYEELKDSFSVSQVRLTAETSLDFDDVDVLLLWSLHHFTEPQLYALDQFLLSGGSALMMTSGMRVDPNILLAQPVPESRADAFYAHLGFRVNRDLVCDQSCTKIKYTDVRPPVLQPYPLFPVLSHQNKGLDSEHETTARLKKLVIPWASSLEPRPGGEVLTQVIARTSDQAWRQENDFLLEPGEVPGPTSFERYNLALSIQGITRSFFADGPPAEQSNTSHMAQGTRPGTVLVWGSEHLLTQTRDSSVLAWLSRSVSFLALRTDLADIDRRENAFRPIRQIDAKTRQAYRWMGTLPIPFVLFILAFARHFKRRRQSWDAYMGGP